jgi:hypothetical protein
MTSTLRRALTFLEKNGRILERRRYAYLFEGASNRAALAALESYQNEDGGFGHALEPDLRGPESEPIPVWTALGLLDELDGFTRSRVDRILAYLESIEVGRAGVPFVLPAATLFPHAPWWDSGPGKPKASINPTAGIAALLHKHRMAAPWLDRATKYSWAEIDRRKVVNPYELRVTLAFLDHVPDRARASEALERLRPRILKGKVVELDPRTKGYHFRPLDFAPEPDRLSRTLFSEDDLARHLDLIETSQAADGGWRVHFPIWTPITRFEWYGWQTLEMLKVLSANGRLPLEATGSTRK